MSKPYRVLTEAEHQIIRHSEHNLDSARSSSSADKVMTTSGMDFPLGETGANLNMVRQYPILYIPVIRFRLLTRVFVVRMLGIFIT